MRKILLGTTAVVGLALLAPVANAQQARPAARPAAAPAAPPPLPATSVAPAGTAAALFQTPVGITGAGPHGPDGVPNRPETPTTSGIVVRLGGFFDFSVGNISDSADSAVASSRGAAAGVNNRLGRQRNDFRTEAELNVYVDGVAANGMRYGAMMEFQMDNMGGMDTSTAAANTPAYNPRGSNGSGTGVDLDELYGFVKGSWGELRFGQEDNAQGLMRVAPPGTLWLGVSSGWDEFVAQPQSGLGGTAPYLMTEFQDGGDATKIIYLSPQFFGFDVGFSYAPQNNEGERADVPTSNAVFQRDRTGVMNAMAGIIRYRGTFGDFGVRASFGALQADSAQTSVGASATVPERSAVRTQNLTMYSAGLLVAAYGFQVGGEYAWGNYRDQMTSTINPKLDGSDHWILGATYTLGAWQFGGQYGVAKQDNGTNASNVPFKDREQTYWGIGLQYTMAPGMILFANYNQVRDDNILTGAPAVAGTGVTSFGSLATFKNGSTTRDIDVLMAGVRVAF
ncbi:MAG: porin [Roseomonas sp.]|nr:porin [Roseomonas sp.]MCA3326255.1 porin [Roseomonas sp.]MCA3332908.1 porin [Roseomonas sp.]MCA3333900.1 porin [Roseomonas sp.]MCA3356203.1 porin [Roseomonas sp.]